MQLTLNLGRQRAYALPDRRRAGTMSYKQWLKSMSYALPPCDVWTG